MNSTTLPMLSCALSYISLSLITLFREIDNVFVLSSISFLILCVFSLIFSWAVSSEPFNKLFAAVYRHTTNDSIWRDVIDLKNGSNLKIHLKDKDYYAIGHFGYYEDSKEDPWISIYGYGKYDENTDDPMEERYLDKNNISMVLRMKDIDYIEVFN